MTKTALIIGGGPAGLMAADTLARQGITVTIADAKPTFGRKFLMAGKSGLNLTMNEPIDAFLSRYDSERIFPMIRAFGPQDVIAWANDLGGQVFTGSSGRVFPKVMKASPLLRAWLARLDDMGVNRRVNWRLTALDGMTCTFATPNGAQTQTADAVILATGGASWARLGSDGAWATLLAKGTTKPFAPANAAVEFAWTTHMDKFMGHPVKAIAMTSGDCVSRGEVILSRKGIEGGGVYPLSRGIRETASLCIDLCPDWSHDKIVAALSKPRGKNSLSNHLRKTLRLDLIKIALLREIVGTLPNDATALAKVIKAVPFTHLSLRPLDEAISTVGGVSWDALDDALMVITQPGVFCAGEMIDWDAPTGGYLITACLATGAWAGRAATKWVGG